MRFAIHAQEGTLNVARVRWQKQSKKGCILRSKCEENARNAFLKRVQFVTLARKGISIVVRVRWQKWTRYMCTVGPRYNEVPRYRKKCSFEYAFNGSLQCGCILDSPRIFNKETG